MSIDVFVLFLAVGASLVALWLVVRFPGVMPRTFGTALLHLGAALVLASAATNGASLLVQSGMRNAAYVATFAIILPSLVYIFTAAAWLITVLQGALGSHRR
jgi:hypothetical protein